MTGAHSDTSYLLDGSDPDLARLLRIAEFSAPGLRDVFSRVGVTEGWRTIDCGCGPLGALAVLAELVGPTGHVVGIDFNAATIERARAVVSALGLGNVEVRVADVHDVQVGELGAPFDLAFTRCFLMHQPDRRRTLRRIAGLLRPGGWLVIHEPLPTPPPTSTPEHPDLARYWAIVEATMRRLGADGDVGRLPQECRDSGFEVVESSGFFLVLPAAEGFELHAATLDAAKGRAGASGAATAEEVDAVVANLRAAASGEFEWVGSPVYLALTVRRT
jgi:SAM-dependent methyltransferase